ncbi:hypothetical protein [Paractinoplanes durhamensis]|uniref:hypothetical protein n=1 Tax=Paractinoplanes durhamensis TaxID=113563 RepID=UPI003627BAC1
MGDLTEGAHATEPWRVHGERSIYDSRWVRLVSVDVEPPASNGSNIMWFGLTPPRWPRWSTTTTGSCYFVDTVSCRRSGPGNCLAA